MKTRRPVLFVILLLLASVAVAWVSAESAQESLEPLKTFVPSEEVTADGAVSFPVDI
jgi:hypothetical protein